MLSRRLLSVPRATPPYICPSCLARQIATIHQARLHSSTALHSNETSASLPLAINGFGRSLEDTATVSHAGQIANNVTRKRTGGEHPSTEKAAASTGKKKSGNQRKIGSAPELTKRKKSMVQKKGMAQQAPNSQQSEETHATRVRRIKAPPKKVKIRPIETTREERMRLVQTPSEGKIRVMEMQASQTEVNLVSRTPRVRQVESNIYPTPSAEHEGQTPAQPAPTQPSRIREVFAKLAVLPSQVPTKADTDEVSRLQGLLEGSAARPTRLMKGRIPAKPALRPRRRLKEMGRSSDPLSQPPVMDVQSFVNQRIAEPSETGAEDNRGKIISAVKGFSSLQEAMSGRVDIRATPTEITTLSADELCLHPVDAAMPPIPKLSHGLDRVLFNPGVYHLQDPRSRVYNFDPYLEKIMPAAEFNFDALGKYLTSSKDPSLINMAKVQGTKYTGSTSSMSGMLVHFHYLLSQWRPLNLGMLSKQFPEISRNFTKTQRCPNSIFLRWQNGTYAIDADKEFDSPNIMSWLGNSMEKLLTNPVHEFERYRKTNPNGVLSESDGDKSFHYTKIGKLLMRSQLDAHDPRLPGTGVFDLKTRAVIPIRMDSSEYEQNLGYQIRFLHGEWESFEREYFDMMRATMLKYSLQVRIGRMDGIFVAYHNIERLFGFQYVSLPDMDLALHGQSDTCLGDQEFKLSAELLSEILDRATAKFPEQSIRLHFETRDVSIPFMYIFAEPVTEEEADEIQARPNPKMLEFERSLTGPRPEDEQMQAEWKEIKERVEIEIDEDQIAEASAGIDEGVAKAEAEAEAEAETKGLSPEEALLDKNAVPELKGLDAGSAPPDVLLQSESNDNVESSTETEITKPDSSEYLEELSPMEAELLDTSTLSRSDKHEAAEIISEAAALNDATVSSTLSNTNDDSTHATPLLGFTLTIRNVVNGAYVKRPEKFTPDDKWSIEYSIDEIPDVNNRPKRLYDALKKRRAASLDRETEIDEKSFRYYRNLISKYTDKGRAWRKEQDEIDEKMGKTVFQPLGRAMQDVVASAGPVVGQTVEKKADGDVENVDDYLGWLYGKRA
ncbi:Pet127-domain-containing protein [Lepidopterella palustris CBS 459.81]|uniref:Pet127-domain-containing protein n=1 Tax=Lepidopterella palustris CBS 459.81 TaxID=1314670 RepID=A0A8E2JB37_9PEZI|nr:Pet127-domain-containing protein [Lepidopterella palustris CBS 459.81]